MSARDGAGKGRLIVSLVAGGGLMLALGVLLGSGLAGGGAAPSPPAPTVTVAPTATTTRVPTSTPVPTATPVPTPTPRIVTGATVVRQIQQASRLETTSYTVQTVVAVERPGGILGVGGQRVLVIVHGTVVAGIDLSKLRPQDVVVSDDGKQVAVKLPPVEILSSALDERRTEVYDHQTGLFTRPDSSLVVEAQKAGAAHVLRAACDDGILRRATTDAQRSLGQVLTLVGFERVIFEDATVPACPTPAPSGSATPSAATPGPTARP